MEEEETEYINQSALLTNVSFSASFIHLANTNNSNKLFSFSLNTGTNLQECSQY